MGNSQHLSKFLRHGTKDNLFTVRGPRTGYRISGVASPVPSTQGDDHCPGPAGHTDADKKYICFYIISLYMHILIKIY